MIVDEHRLISSLLFSTRVQWMTRQECPISLPFPAPGIATRPHSTDESVTPASDHFLKYWGRCECTPFSITTVQLCWTNLFQNNERAEEHTPIPKPEITKSMEDSVYYRCTIAKLNRSKESGPWCVLKWWSNDFEADTLTATPRLHLNVECLHSSFYFVCVTCELFVNKSYIFHFLVNKS